MPIGNFGNFGNFLVLFELFQNLYEKYHPEDTDFQWEKKFSRDRKIPIWKFALGNIISRDTKNPIGHFPISPMGKEVFTR